MNNELTDEEQKAILIGAGIAVPILIAFWITQSWEKVFAGIAVLFGALMIGCFLYMVLRFLFEKMGQVVTAAVWLQGLDKELGEIKELINHFGHRLDSQRQRLEAIETLLKQITTVLKKDSAAMADRSVQETIDSLFAPD